jgi:RHS repeat-associated protein
VCAPAWQAAAHVDTPTVSHFDALGRAFLTVVRNRVVCANHPLDGAEGDVTSRIELDISGQERVIRDAVLDPPDRLGRVVMTYDYDLLGNRIHEWSIDAGGRWVLVDVTGNPLVAWDDRGHRTRTEYDRARRPVRGFVVEAHGPELLVDRIVYGSQHPDAEVRNLSGSVWLHFDQAGVASTERIDIGGNTLAATRRLTGGTRYRATVDWSAVDAALPASASVDVASLAGVLAAHLDSRVYESASEFDALNRPIRMTSPHAAGMTPNVVERTYGVGGALETLRGRLNGSATWTTFVAALEYDAKGRRASVELGNGVVTRHSYDTETFRLTRTRTTRAGAPIQDVSYTYDPASNITHIEDATQPTIFYANKVAEASSSYVYDATYRLVEATGREQLGQGAIRPHTADDSTFAGEILPGDGQAMGRYVERYVYDLVGNILEMRHVGTSMPGWTRTFDYQGAGNRLTSTTVGAANPVVERYLHDAHGNMTRMPHLGGLAPHQNLMWNHRDQLSSVDLGAGGTAYYVYDANGERVRKIVERSNNHVEERIYLGSFEIYRRRQGAEEFERETVHVMDDAKRVALVETRTRDTAGTDRASPRLIRYQFDNHLGSAVVELDDVARVISYEEYSAYGSTTYRAASSADEAPKRYRFTGKERDEETGFGYHGARYLAHWLGRWTSADPKRGRAHPNSYEYVSGNPLILVDPDGREGTFATRAWGAVRAVGGVLQIAGGGVALAVPEPTMLTKVGGVIAIGHGASDFGAGMEQIWTGKEAVSVTQYAVTKVASTVVTDDRAKKVGVIVDVGLGFVNPAGPINNIPRAAPQLATAGGGVMSSSRVLAPAAQAVKPVQLAEMSNLSHAATGLQTAKENAKNGPGEPSAYSPSPNRNGATRPTADLLKEARRQARLNARSDMRSRMLAGKMTEADIRAIELLQAHGVKALETYEETGRLPRGFEFSHLYSASAEPELASRGDLGVFTEKLDHLYGHHGGDTTVPLHGQPRNPGWQDGHGMQIVSDTPEGRSYAGMTDHD